DELADVGRRRRDDARQQRQEPQADRERHRGAPHEVQRAPAVAEDTQELGEETWMRRFSGFIHLDLGRTRRASDQLHPPGSSLPCSSVGWAPLWLARLATKVRSSRNVNGLRMRSFGTSSRKARALGVNAPPVMNTKRCSIPGRRSRTRA